jgi:hypothetical protein
MSEPPFIKGVTHKTLGALGGDGAPRSLRSKTGSMATDLKDYQCELIARQHTQIAEIVEIGN